MMSCKSSVIELGMLKKINDKNKIGRMTEEKTPVKEYWRAEQVEER